MNDATDDDDHHCNGAKASGEGTTQGNPRVNLVVNYDRHTVLESRRSRDSATACFDREESFGSVCADSSVGYEIIQVLFSGSLLRITEVC